MRSVIALAAVDAIDDVAVLAVDRRLTVVAAAGGGLERHGWDGDSIVGLAVEDLFADPSVAGRVRSALAGRGSTFTTEQSAGATVAPVRDEAREVVGCTILLRARAGDELALEAEAFGSAPAGMAILDADGRCLRVNSRLCEITGRPADSLIGHHLSDLVHPDDLGAEGAARDRPPGAQVLTTGDERVMRPDGSTVWVVRRIAPIASRSDRFSCVVIDISARRLAEAHAEALEARLEKLAATDPLTGLANRRTFGQEVRVQLARARRYGEEAGLLVIDLDRFKEVNDSLGHQAGDELLVQVARAIESCTRESDLAARLGGDEFAVLATQTDEEGVNSLAEKLLARVAEASHEASPAVPVSASIGIALVRGETAGDVDPFVLADRALYAAKEKGRGRAARHPARPA